MVKTSGAKRETKGDLILTHFPIVGKFPAPIRGCLLFLRDCDEVLEVSFLAAVKPSAAGTATFFKVPSAVEAVSWGFRSSETQSADKASSYVFTPLFLGADYDVISRRVNESCTHARTPRCVVQSVRQFSLSLPEFHYPYEISQLAQII